jgi:hypothetical protein
MDWFGLVSDTDAGVILEQMVQSLDCRVRELRRELGLKFNVLEATLVQLILLRDIDVLSQEEFDREIKEIASYKNDTEWSGIERTRKTLGKKKSCGRSGQREGFDRP